MRERDNQGEPQMRVQEIWKPIKGYECKYEVSSMGRVRSLMFSNKVASYKREIPKIFINTVNLGYARVPLSKNNKVVRYPVHRLVANAFIENIENKPCVNHKDGNKLNNTVKNLEWVTYRENSIHAAKNLLMASCQRHGCAKLANSEVLKIRFMRKDGCSYGEIVKAFPFITKTTIADICKRRIWKNI